MTSGTAIATRLFADVPLMPLIEESALVSEFALDPRRELRSPEPAFTSRFPLPVANSSPILPGRFASICGLFSVFNRELAPPGEEPFWTMEPSKAGSILVIADLVFDWLSPRN
jgi:hypothetical protein